MRPCVFTRCRFHITVPKKRRGQPEYPWVASCAIDIADEGSHTLEDVGQFMGLTRERVRQLEIGALIKIRTGHRRPMVGLDPVEDDDE